MDIANIERIDTALKAESLNDMYGHMSLGEVEAIVDEAITWAVQYTAKGVGALFHLEQTQKFREDPRYKDSTFEDYLKYRFYMSYSKFRDLRISFNNYPREMLTYGPQVVAEVRKKCGALNAPKVFQEIQEGCNGLEEIKATIEKYSTPAPPLDRPATIKSYESDVEKFRRLFIESQETVVEQAEQIDKLKKTVVEYKNRCKECPYGTADDGRIR